MYKGYLIDLDGVAYKGSEVIESCIYFTQFLKEKGIPFCFITNNSTRQPEEVYRILSQMGYNINPDHIVTSSIVTAEYIYNQDKDAKVYLVGMEGIKNELTKRGISIVEQGADYVVIGLDTTLTYDQLASASLEVSSGATLIATNMDFKFPSEKGIVPGNGSIIKTVEYTTGIKPLIMGKPEKAMLDYGLKLLNLNKDEVAIVGDNYHTDLLLGLNYGVDTIFVETGIMTKEDLNQYDKKPTHCVSNLSEWVDDHLKTR